MGIAEYRDGNFGDFMPIKEFREYMETIMNQEKVFQENVASFHFGTEEELEEVKEKAKIQDRMDKIELEMQDMKPLKSNIIHIPTQEELMQFTREEVRKKILT